MEASGHTHLLDEEKVLSYVLGTAAVWAGQYVVAPATYLAILGKGRHAAAPRARLRGLARPTCADVKAVRARQRRRRHGARWPRRGGRAAAGAVGECGGERMSGGGRLHMLCAVWWDERSREKESRKPFLKLVWPDKRDH